MTVLDIGNNISVSNSLPPESTTSASVRNGASFDTRGYTWGVAIFIMGNMDAAATEAFAVEDSADDSSFAVRQGGFGRWRSGRNDCSRSLRRQFRGDDCHRLHQHAQVCALYGEVQHRRRASLQLRDCRNACLHG